MARGKRLTSQQVGLKYGFRSGLEKTVAKQLQDLGISYKYEEMKIPYTNPMIHKYTPDFHELPNGIIVETKGRWLGSDRKKHQLIKQQHPHLDIRFVFNNSRARLSKVSKTTYGAWCEKNGFKYADKLIPQEWLQEEKK